MKVFTKVLFLFVMLALATQGLVMAQNSDSKSGGKLSVNINTAGQAELEKLPGIGPALAKKILEFRQKNGNFKTAAEITAVPGVGDKKYEAIKEMITVK